MRKQPRLKASVLLDPGRPKVKIGEVLKILNEAGIKYSPRNADLGVVIGGDGVFSHYGRIESGPLLFVGVRPEKPIGSKAYLAEAYVDNLNEALIDVKQGRYDVVEYKRLEVLVDGSKLGEVFTDVYLEKGAESNCLRYKVITKGPGFRFTDFCIGNGVVVCTRAGSTGYFSYLDKLKLGDWLEPDRHVIIGENEVGVCHVVPTYTVREGTAEHPARYTVPWGTEIRIQLMREADARLYGVTKEREGVRVGLQDVIAIRPSPNSTHVIKVKPHLRK